MRSARRTGLLLAASSALVALGVAGAVLALPAPPTAAFPDGGEPAPAPAVASFADLAPAPRIPPDENLLLMAVNPYEAAVAATPVVYGEPMWNPYVEERALANPYSDALPRPTDAALSTGNPYSSALRAAHVGANPYSAQVRAAAVGANPYTAELRTERELLSDNPYSGLRAGR